MLDLDQSLAYPNYNFCGPFTEPNFLDGRGVEGSPNFCNHDNWQEGLLDINQFELRVRISVLAVLFGGPYLGFSFLGDIMR